MRYLNIYNKLTNDVWLIKPSVLQSMISILEKHELKKGLKIEGINENQDGEDYILSLPVPVLSEKVGNITVIKIHGVIGQHLSSLEMACGGVDTISIADELDKAILDQTCSGILLSVSSPGGVVTGVMELADKIKSATAIKPVIAFTDSEICSAAYWLACQTDEILGTKSSCIGSIGAYISLLDSSKAYEMAGLKRELFKDGTYKAAGIDGKPLSDTDKQILQASVDSISGKFKEAVRKNGSVKDEVMQGQTFFGYEAINNGLIDVIVNDENEALQYLSELIDTVK